YVTDSVSIRAELSEFYKTEFPAYKYFIDIKFDPEWEAYLQFLYPNEETQEFMANEKVLAQLRQAGDDLSKPRQVDHWIYFKDNRSRNSFLGLVKSEGFSIVGKAKIKKSALPYRLHISRIDDVGPAEIYKV